MSNTRIAILERENTSLKEKNESLENLIRHVREEHARLVHLIKVGNQNRFGAKSEKFIPHNQPSLFQTEEVVVNEPKAEEIETITYQRPKRKNLKKIQGNLPRREVIIPVPQEQRVCHCGCEKQFVRYEETQKIHHIPAIFEIVEEKREVIACPKGCENSIATAPLPKTALPKICATEEFVGYVAVSKILDRQPLYHLAKQFSERHGVHISRQTMASWLIKLVPVLQPLLNMMKENLLSYDIAAFDATHIQVLNEPNRPANRKSYAYCFRGGPPGKEVVLYEYVAEKHKEFLEEYFMEYKGTLQVDADPFFEDLPLDGLKKLSYCNAHARRKFAEIVKVTESEGLATEAMVFFQKIYKIERKAKDLKMTSEQRCQLRKQETSPIMEEFKRWLEKYRDEVLPKSPLSQAMQYTLKHWEGLNRFLDDGRLEADNNLTEQQIKYFVMGRKNFLFSDTVEGADALTTLYGVFLTAKVHQLNPLDYIVYVLKQIPHCQNFNDYEKLLPWNLSSTT
jgi:transposase